MRWPIKIVREWSLFDRPAHEHGDRAPDALVDINDEYFVDVPEENRATAARRQDRSHLHLHDCFIHQKNRNRPISKNKRVAAAVP